VPLLVQSEERKRQEAARAAHVEFLARLERREAVWVFLLCILFLVCEAFLVGLSMHLTGTSAVWALAGGACCGIGPSVTIIAWQIRRERSA
jgi:hypothetical protein